MDSIPVSDQKLRIAIMYVHSNSPLWAINRITTFRGAGIGGLTLSSALGILGRGRNFELDIYEGATHISEIGAGINFWPRTWEIMKSLGLDHELARMLPHVPDNNPREFAIYISPTPWLTLVTCEVSSLKSARVISSKEFTSRTWWWKVPIYSQKLKCLRHSCYRGSDTATQSRPTEDSDK